MALKNYQQAISLDTLYECRLKGGVSGSEQLKPNLYTDAGTVDVYGSNSATQPTALADMVLNTENTAVAAGITSFSIIPRWIAIVQNTDTTNELMLTGVEATEMGSIS
jgi:hypothetical protein